MTSRTANTQPHIPNLLPDFNAPHIAWWYGRLIPNTRDRTQPKVEVLFRRQNEDGSTEGGGTVVYPVNIAVLAQVPLGSVWLHRQQRVDAPLQQRTFRVDFSSSGHELLQSLHQFDTGHYLIPPFAYPLLNGFKTHESNAWTIAFHLNNGGRLIVPAIEFMIKSYGLSGEVHRVLLTYTWEETLRRLFGEHQPKVAGNAKRWVIHPGKYMHHADYPFLAHLLYDSDTQRLAKSVWSQLSMSTEPSTHLKIQPWQRNQGLIEVMGHELPGNSFLALRITGIELPSHPPIEVLHINLSDTPESTGHTPEGGTNPVTVINLPEPEMPLANDQAPDHGGGFVEITNERFRWLGQPGTILHTHIDKPKTAQGGSILPNEIDEVSTGDPYGSLEGRGKLVSDTPIEIESRGTLRDMWDAILRLKKEHPKEILDAGYMTWSGHTQSGSEPKLCLFPVSAYRSKKATWLLVDKEKEEPRGLLLIWIKTRLCETVIMEFQRRRNPIADTETEAFRGLIARLDNKHATVLQWLAEVAAEAAAKRGVFPKEKIQECPTRAYTFKHSTTGDKKIDITPWRALLAVGALEPKRHKEPKGTS